MVPLISDGESGLSLVPGLPSNSATLLDAPVDRAQALWAPPLQLHAVQSLRGMCVCWVLIPLPVRFVGPPVGLSPLPFAVPPWVPGWVLVLQTPLGTECGQVSCQAFCHPGFLWNFALLLVYFCGADSRAWGMDLCLDKHSSGAPESVASQSPGQVAGWWSPDKRPAPGRWKVWFWRFHSIRNKNSLSF